MWETALKSSLFVCAPSWQCCTSVSAESWLNLNGLESYQTWSLAILVVLLLVRWVIAEPRVLGIGRSGFAFQSCLCERVGWPWDVQCRSVPPFPRRFLRTIDSNCCEEVQCNHDRKGVGVNQTKRQNLLYCHSSTVMSITAVTVQYTLSLGKVGCLRCARRTDKFSLNEENVWGRNLEGLAAGIAFNITQSTNSKCHF